MPLVAGNWKMHSTHFEAIALTQKLAFSLTKKDFAAAEIAILPPFTALRSVQTLVEGDKLELRYGAQDVSAHDDGAYTGEISGRMLAKLGCAYVLAGHSERRQYHAEDDQLVNAKVKAALQHGIRPVLCVGEPLAVRQAGDHIAHTLSQLDGGLDGLTVAQDPDLRLSARRRASARCCGRWKAAGHISQCLVRHAKHVLSLIDNDRGGRGHARHQRQIAVIDADHDVVGDDVLHCLRRLTPLNHGALEYPLWKSIDGKSGGVAFLDPAHVGFAGIRIHLHLFEVCGDEKQRRRLEARGDRLPAGYAA
jgi:hypothetical protein